MGRRLPRPNSGGIFLREVRGSRDSVMSHGGLRMMCVGLVKFHGLGDGRQEMLGTVHIER